MEFDFKENYSINDLLHIIDILRSPGGCPWDREQTHKSLKRNFIEETYEAVEAIDNDDKTLLREELGDVLLQVVLHCRIGKESKSFDFDDVCDGICKKLILRHPHVFSDVDVSGSEEALRNWDNIKMHSKEQKCQSEAMQSVSKALPALIRSEKVQAKAAKVGFDYQDAELSLRKVREESEELKDAICSNSAEACKEEVGDLLFSAVNVSRLLGVDPEDALNRSTDKFINRFKKLEKLAIKRQVKMESASLDELDNLWDNVKED